jgi:hypothetical protein
LTRAEAPGTTKTSGKNIQKNSDGKDEPAAPSVPVQIPAPTPPTDANRGQITPKDTEYSVKLTGVPVVTIADKNRGFIDYVFDWGPWFFSFILVGVGVVGVIVAHRTRLAIERQATLMGTQAELMDRQTDLLEAQYYQWVELTNIRTIFESEDASRKLTIKIDVLNPTNCPMTLTKTFIRLGKIRSATQGAVFLAPHDFYTTEDFAALDEKQWTKLLDGNLLLEAEGDFSHFGPLGKKVTTEQSFRGMLHCGIGAKIHYELHMNPERRNEDKSGNT